MLDLKETVEREWLQGRYHVLELAGLLDRLEVLAAGEKGGEDVRIGILRRAIRELEKGGGGVGRAGRILQMYSEMAAPAR